MRLTTRFGSLAAVAALALVAGCSGGGSQVPSTQSVGHHSLPSIMSVHNLMGHSYIATSKGVQPSVQRHVKTHWVMGKPITDTVFISDYGNNDITLFTFPGHSVEGTIGGLSNPQGMSVDSSHNLLVANTGASDINIYASPWTGSPTTLSDSGYYPTDVVKDSSGNCYVSNIYNTSFGAGSVVMYSGCSGSPTTLNMSGACYSCRFIAIDPTTGNVWVDGLDASGFPDIGYWGPGGSGSFTSVPITYNFPGGIQFLRNGTLLLDDQEGNTEFFSSTVNVYPPGSTTMSAQYQLSSDNTDVVTIKLGAIMKRLFGGDASSANQPILSWQAGNGTVGQIVGANVLSGYSLPIGVAANPEAR